MADCMVLANQMMMIVLSFVGKACFQIFIVIGWMKIWYFERIQLSVESTTERCIYETNACRIVGCCGEDVKNLLDLGLFNGSSQSIQSGS